MAAPAPPRPGARPAGGRPAGGPPVPRSRRAPAAGKGAKDKGQKGGAKGGGAAGAPRGAAARRGLGGRPADSVGWAPGRFPSLVDLFGPPPGHVTRHCGQRGEPTSRRGVCAGHRAGWTAVIEDDLAWQVRAERRLGEGMVAKVQCIDVPTFMLWGCGLAPAPFITHEADDLELEMLRRSGAANNWCTTSIAPLRDSAARFAERARATPLSANMCDAEASSLAASLISYIQDADIRAYIASLEWHAVLSIFAQQAVPDTRRYKAGDHASVLLQPWDIIEAVADAALRVLASSTTPPSRLKQCRGITY
eukprot:gene3708-6631_t